MHTTFRWILTRFRWVQAEGLRRSSRARSVIDYSVYSGSAASRALRPADEYQERARSDSARTRRQQGAVQRQANTQQRRAARAVAGPEQRQQEREANAQRMHAVREGAGPEQRQQEREANAQRMQAVREAGSPEQRQQEREANAQRMQAIREAASPEQRQQERVANTQQRQAAREAARPEQRQQEREANTQQRQAAREAARPEQRQQEREANTQQRQTARAAASPEQRQQERVSNATQHRASRSQRGGAGVDAQQGFLARLRQPNFQFQPGDGELLDALFDHDVRAARLAFYQATGFLEFNEELDDPALVDAVRAQRLDDERKLEIVREFLRQMDVAADLLACASCGELSIAAGCSPVALDRLGCLRYTDEQVADFDQRPHTYRQVKSSYVAPDNTRYHLHPELVQPDGRVPLCSRCQTAVARDQIPRLSIASGCDFGHLARAGVAEPTAAEKVVAGRARLHVTVIKLSSRSSGPGSQYSALRGHSITFEQAGLEVICEAADAAIRNAELLPQLIRVVFLGPTGRRERVRMDVGPLVTLDADKLLRMLAVFKDCHGEYANLELPDRDVLEQALQAAHQSILDNMVVLDDADDIEADAIATSDVAAVRHQDEPLLGDPEATVPGAPLVLDAVFVTSGTAQVDERAAERQARALYNAAGPDDDPSSSSDEESDTYTEPDSFIDSESSDSSAESEPAPPEDEPEQDPAPAPPQPAPDEPVEHQLRRQQDPINEVQDTRRLLALAFPHLFPLGVGPGRGGALNVEERRHVLRQWHRWHARDASFLFQLFDSWRRMLVNSTISGRVINTPASLQAIADELAHPDFPERLRQAVADPDAEESRALHRRIEAHLEVIGQRVPYSEQARKAALKLLYAMCYAFGAPSLFTTVSPDESFQGMVLRVACPRDTVNVGMPSSLEDFFERLRTDGAVQIGQYRLDHSAARSLAANDPVATAEYAGYLTHAFFEKVVGMPMVSETRKSTPLELRRTGLFGLPLGFFMCVETTGRGALHTHGLFFGGLPPRLLQRIAHVPDLVHEVGAVLSDLITCSLPLEQHVRGLLRRMGKLPQDRPALHADQIRAAAFEDADFVAVVLVVRSDEFGGIVQVHLHTFTCRKGVTGLTSCREARPQPTCPPTDEPIRVVQLSVRPEYAVRHVARDRIDVDPANRTAWVQEYVNQRSQAHRRDQRPPQRPAVDPWIEIPVELPPDALPPDEWPLLPRDERLIVYEFNRVAIHDQIFDADGHVQAGCLVRLLW